MTRVVVCCCRGGTQGPTLLEATVCLEKDRGRKEPGVTVAFEEREEDTGLLFICSTMIPLTATTLVCGTEDGRDDDTTDVTGDDAGFLCSGLKGHKREKLIRGKNNQEKQNIE